MNYNGLNKYLNLLKVSLHVFLTDQDYDTINKQILNIIEFVTNCKTNFNSLLFRLSFFPNSDSLLPKELYTSFENFKSLTRNIVIVIVQANQSKYPSLDHLENVIHVRVEEIPIPSHSFQPADYVRIVAILVDNALIALSYKYFDNSEPRVDLIVRIRENRLTITVIDNGIGLPAGVPPRSLLDKFVSRWPRPNRRMGNELYKCKELVDKNYGTIELIADGSHARVEVSLFLPR